MIVNDMMDRVEEILGILADDNFENWSEYWQDQNVYKERIRTILDEWFHYCEEKGKE